MNLKYLLYKFLLLIKLKISKLFDLLIKSISREKCDQITYAHLSITSRLNHSFIRHNMIKHHIPSITRNMKKQNFKNKCTEKLREIMRKRLRYRNTKQNKVFLGEVRLHLKSFLSLLFLFYIVRGF